MRIRVVSDLHQEFGEAPLPKVDCDCVVMAGDISTKTNGLKWILREITDVPVIYICGNHEFYGENYPSLFDKLREQSRGTNVHFLENESVTIGGVRFFGSTLWTDMGLMGHWMDGATGAGSVMNDYKRVRNSARGYKRLSPRDTRLTHLSSVAALRDFLSSGEPRQSVIVTHHAPSLLSLSEHRRTEPISCAYASHLDALIHEFQPRLWCMAIFITTTTIGLEKPASWRTRAPIHTIQTRASSLTSSSRSMTHDLFKSWHSAACAPHSLPGASSSISPLINLLQNHGHSVRHCSFLRGAK